MMPLTKTQARCLDAIKAEIAAGSVPTLSRLAARLEVKYPSTVHSCLRRLEQRGFIRRVPSATGAIELVEPKSMQAVLLSKEVFRLVQAYAASQRISVDCAASELLRDSLGASV